MLTSELMNVKEALEDAYGEDLFIKSFNILKGS